MSPRDATEFRAMFEMALDGQAPAAIRYPRTFAPHPAKELPVRRELVRGRAETLRTGGDLAIVALGHMAYPALEAAESLAAHGIQATVVNARFVRPLDVETIRDLADRLPHVFTIEEHSIRGGFAAQVLEELALVRGRADRIRPIAIPDAFVPHGTRGELLRELRLDPAGLAARMSEVLGVPAPGRRPAGTWSQSSRVP
jgi:1-deoxy-D-xylulose-5-phosphate synthase